MAMCGKKFGYFLDIEIKTLAFEVRKCVIWLRMRRPRDFGSLLWRIWYYIILGYICNYSIIAIYSSLSRQFPKKVEVHNILQIIIHWEVIPKLATPLARFQIFIGYWNVGRITILTSNTKFSSFLIKYKINS